MLSNQMNTLHVVQRRRAARMGAAALPLAAINWENFTPGNIQKGFTTFRDRVYYGDVLPPVGSQTLSYARMLEMLSTRKVRVRGAGPGSGPGCSTGLERAVFPAGQPCRLGVLVGTAVTVNPMGVGQAHIHTGRRQGGAGGDACRGLRAAAG